MKIIINFITNFIIPFCFGFIVSKAFRNGDTAMVMMAIIGFIADLLLIICSKG